MNMVITESTTGRLILVVVLIKIHKAALTNSGIVKIVKRLLTDVRDTESVTLPLKIYVTKPEVVPPGHDARMMNPTFNAGESGEK